MGKIQPSWAYRYSQLKDYLNTHDSYPKLDNIKLSFWISVNKKKYIVNKLPEHQIKLLEELPGWQWRSYRTSSFMQRIYDYTSFIKTHRKQPRLSSNYCKCPIESQLQNWYLRQRYFYRYGYMIKRFIPAFEELLRDLRNMHLEANATQLELI
jgi:hypothetical protein